MSLPPYPGRVMLPLLLRLAPALMGVLTLLVLEMGVEVTPRSVAKRAEARDPDTRLIVVWIDSLDLRDMEDLDRMPRLRARMKTGLHGPVRSCNDAMTVPCFTAMQLGLDRFSLFAIFKNFGGTVGLDPQSIIRVLQADGVRTGYIGDTIVAPAAKGVDWWVASEDDDVARIDHGLRALDDKNLDFLIIHLTGSDEVAHRHGDAHPAYAEALRAVDERIDAIWPTLGPRDHLMILGDHGHLANGVHSPGLDLPTYAVVVGPSFDRPLYRPMVVTEFGAIWADIFGHDFGPVDWLERYRRGETPAPITDMPAPPVVPSDLAWWATLAALLLALLAAVPLRRGSWRHWLDRRLLLSFALLCVVGFVAGMYYKDYRPYVHFQPGLFDLGFALACAVFGAILLLPALPRTRWHHRMFAGVVLVALPTLYGHGGPRVAIAGLLIFLGVNAYHALRARDRAAVALNLTIALVAVGVWFPTASNFALRSFPHHALPTWVALGGAIAFFLLAFYLAAAPPLEGAADNRAEPAAGARTSWYRACAIALVLAVLVPVTPARLWIVPCVAAFPVIMLAMWRPRYESLAVILAVPAIVFLHQADVRHLLPAAGVLLCFAAWGHLSQREDTRETPVWVHGLVLIMLVWLGYWAMGAIRANGYDFTYFFRWLGADGDVEETWYLNTPMTIVKYAVHSALGLLLYRRIAPHALLARFEHARDIMQVKLAIVLITILGFATAGSMGTFLAADVLQEGALWSVMILLFTWATPVRR